MSLTMNNPPPYRVRVSNRFLSLSLLCSILVAFAIGRIVRIVFIVGPQKQLLERIQELSASQERLEGVKHKGDHVLKLPDPVLKNKPIPKTLYTAKNFDTARSSSINSRWVVTDESDSDQCPSTLSKKEFDSPEPVKSDSNSSSSAEEEEDVHMYRITIQDMLHGNQQDGAVL